MKPWPARAALALDERAYAVGGWPVLMLRGLCWLVSTGVAGVFTLAALRLGVPTGLGVLLIYAAIGAAYLLGVSEP